MDKQTYKQMEQDLITLANNHNAEYSNQLTDYDDFPCFTILKHNVPTIADMRMLAEKYGVSDVLVSDGSWGYVALDFTMRQFKDEDDYNNFVNMTKN